MADLATMLWKEVAEFAGNRRFLRTFGIAVLIFGLLPSLERGAAAAPLAATILGLGYVAFSSTVVVAQAAPDLVLHERAGGSLEYLLATRLPDAAIFLGKVLLAAAVGYGTALITMALQLLALNLRHAAGPGWHWAYLGLPAGRLLVLGGPAALDLYIATVGTFVALRAGDQRAAYLITMLCAVVLVLPFALGLLPVHLTAAWALGTVAGLGALALVLVGLGLALFRRERIILYLQE
jgi:hypothetical protein